MKVFQKACNRSYFIFLIFFLLTQYAKSDPSLSPALKSDSVENLGEKLSALEEEKKSIENDKQTIEVEKEDLQKKKKALDALVSEYQSILDAKKNKGKLKDNAQEKTEKPGEKKETKNILTIYESMDPKRAAHILESLSPTLASQLIQKMNSQKAAEILAQMKPEIAKAITQKVLE